MKKTILFKQFALISLITITFTACATQNSAYPRTNNSQMTKTQTGALIGGILGAVIGAASKGDNKAGRAMIGGAIGAIVGSGVAYSMDQQAKEVAQELETRVDNNPQAALNPDNDLIVSNTEEYVKIMLRDSMVFETNSSIPTYQASRKIAKISDVLRKYPNTLIQVVGFTDSRGSYEYNQKLSEQRASNVGNTIYNSGIDNQIFSKGCSFNKPIAPNTNATNMGLNRRVEIYLYANQNDIIDACLQ